MRNSSKIQDLAKWLRRRGRGFDALGYVIIGVGFSLVWAVLIGSVRAGLFGMPTVNDPKQLVDKFELVLHWAFFFALCEELIFRGLLLKAFSIVFIRPRDIGWGIAFSSLLFGLAHYSPDNPSLFSVILIQGVLGVVLSLIYLKTGGYQGKPFHGFFWATLAHGSYNTILAGFGLVVMSYALRS